MCQTIPSCYEELPCDKERDAIWEARWFAQHKLTGTHEEFVAHLKKKGVHISLQTLKHKLESALRSTQNENPASQRKKDFQKILALLPE